LLYSGRAEDAVTVIRSLMSTFRVDAGSCTGYDQAIREETHRFLREHATQIVPPLREVMCAKPPPNPKMLALTPPILSTYTASPSPSPVQAGLAQVISTAAGGIGKLVAPAPVPSPGKLAGPLDLPQCKVTKTTLPPDVRWAQVSVTDTIGIQDLLTPCYVHDRVTHRLTPPPTPTKDTKKDSAPADKANAKTAAKPAAKPPQKPTGPLADLNDTLLAAFPPPADPAKSPCQRHSDSLSDTDLKSLQAALTAVLNKVLPSITDPEQRAQGRAILADYQTLLAASSQAGTPITAQTTYTYGPLTHWSFGLGAGAVFRPNLNQQVKLSGTTLVDDPLNGVMTSVNVYHNLWPFLPGYDENTLKPQASELFRWVGGIVLTPDPGGFLGIAIGIPSPDFRNVTINGGYAVMAATTPVGDAQIGATGKTKRGALGAWVIQMGYSF
jgi:hypothetical protein